MCSFSKLEPLKPNPKATQAQLEEKMRAAESKREQVSIWYLIKWSKELNKNFIHFILN